MHDGAGILRAYGELPENIRLNEGIAGGLDEEDDKAADDYIDFEAEHIDKISVPATSSAPSSNHFHFHRIFRLSTLSTTAERLGLPYLNAYVDSIGSNFQHVANFAASGCTIQLADALMLNRAFNPLTFDVQHS